MKCSNILFVLIQFFMLRIDSKFQTFILQVGKMSKVYVKTYNPYTISGDDFASVQSRAMRRIVFSPNKKDAISISKLHDGCLLISNGNKVPFEFTISREGKCIAVIEHRANDQAVNINTNWRLTEAGVENRQINTNPDLIRSAIMNIDVQCDGISRIDLKVDDSGFAACTFTRELLFVRMNGNHVVPRLMGFIENEKERVKRKMQAEIPAIEKAYFRKCFYEVFLPQNPNH